MSSSEFGARRVQKSRDDGLIAVSDVSAYMALPRYYSRDRIRQRTSLPLCLYQVKFREIVASPVNTRSIAAQWNFMCHSMARYNTTVPHTDGEIKVGLSSAPGMNF